MKCLSLLPFFSSISKKELKLQEMFKIIVCVLLLQKFGLINSGLKFNFEDSEVSATILVTLNMNIIFLKLMVLMLSGLSTLLVTGVHNLLPNIFIKPHSFSLF